MAGELNITDNSTAVIDPAGGFAYFASAPTGSPSGAIVKVRLSDFTRVSNALSFSGFSFQESVIDPAGGFAYFCTDTASVLKIRLSDFTNVGTAHP